MPRSFLISRKRKLTFDTAKQSCKLTKVVKPSLITEDVGNLFSVCRETCNENNCKNKYSKNPMHFDKASGNKCNIGNVNNCEYSRSQQQTSHPTHPLTNSLKYARTQDETENNLHFSAGDSHYETKDSNSTLKDSESPCKYSNFTCQESSSTVIDWNSSINGSISSTKYSNSQVKYSTSDKTTINDNNNNNVNSKKYKDSESEFFSENVVERKCIKEAIIEQILGPEGNSMIGKTALLEHSSSIDRIVKTKSHNQSSIALKHYKNPTKATGWKFHDGKEQCPDVGEVKTLAVLRNFEIERNEGISDRDTQSEKFMTQNQTSRTAMPELQYKDITEQKDLVCTSKIHDKKLSVSELHGNQTNLQSYSADKTKTPASQDATVLPPKSLLPSWSERNVCQIDVPATPVSSQHNDDGEVCWLILAEKLNDGDEKKVRELDVENMKERQRESRDRFCDNSSPDVRFSSSISNPAYSISPHTSPSRNMTSYHQLPERAITCAYTAASEVAQNCYNCPDRHGHTHSSSFISSINSLKKASQLVFPETNIDLSMNDLITKSVLSNLESKSNQSENNNSVHCTQVLKSNNQNLPLFQSEHRTFQLEHRTFQSEQKPASFGQEIKDDLIKAEFDIPSAYPIQEMSERIRNKDFQSKEVLAESHVSKNSTSATIIEKQRKLPSKSFMISSIINECTDDNGKGDNEAQSEQMRCKITSSGENQFMASTLVDNKDNLSPSSGSSHLVKHNFSESPKSSRSSSHITTLENCNLHKRMFHVNDPNHKPFTNSTDNIVPKEENDSSNPTLSNSSNLHINMKTNAKLIKASPHIITTLTNVPLAYDMPRKSPNTSNGSRSNDFFNSNCYKRSSVPENNQHRTGSLNHQHDHRKKGLNKSPPPSSVNMYYSRAPTNFLRHNYLPNKLLHREQMNTNVWRRKIKGVYNPIPVRYHPTTMFFNNVASPAIYWQPSIPHIKHSEINNFNVANTNKHSDSPPESFLGIKDTLGQSPICDASRNVSTGPLIPTNILSPSTLRSGNIGCKQEGFREVSRQLLQSKEKQLPKADLGYRTCDKSQKTEISEFKSFKSILEQRNVKLECINGGNGIKNPLLNTELVGNKMGLVPNCALSCPVCNLTFDLAKHLQKHLKSHREIKRFLCSFCGKGFNDTFDLKRHTRTHTGVRPYKCDQCDKAFTQRCSLESHSRKIHGFSEHLAFNERRLKVYVCELCGHSTDQADDHYAHNRLAHPTSQFKRRIST